jgi:hypothetical protein
LLDASRQKSEAISVMEAAAHGIGCCQQYAIGGLDAPAGDAVRRVPEKAGDRRLVVAEVGGKTGEAVV